MDAKLKKKWVKALLSGEYRQGLGALESGGRYCCLGVLRHVADKHDKRSDYDCGDLLSEAQLKAFGLTQREQEALADMNDDEGVPFDMIAGLIDEAL